MAHYMPAPITAHWLATDASKDYKEAPPRIKDYNQG